MTTHEVTLASCTNAASITVTHCHYRGLSTSFWGLMKDIVTNTCLTGLYPPPLSLSPSRPGSVYHLCSYQVYLQQLSIELSECCVLPFPHEAITPRTVDSSVRTSLLVSEPPQVWGPYKHKSYTLNFLTERQSHCVVPLALPLYQLRHTDALRGEQHGVWRLCSGLAGWSLLSCIFWRLPYQSLEEDSNLSHHSSEKMLGLPGSFLAPVLGSQITKAARFMAMFQERSYFTYR